ncbi:MAG: intermembrane transport protein PqiB [Phycisphaerales bacterium JB059]
MTQPEAPIPTARLVRRRRFNPAWLVPLVVLALIIAVAWQGFQSRGHLITIRFANADGARVGDAIVYRGLRVGAITALSLAPDRQHVNITAELTPDAASLANRGAVFWIVRPEVSLERISGLDTLVGPQYIALLPGPEDAPPADTFVGLDAPPVLAARAASDDFLVRLQAPRLGSLSVGSPVTYRDIPVGRIVHTRLAPDATGVIIHATIDSDYTPLIRERTRFWNTSGISADFGLFAGLSVRADSLESVISGAIAFATPDRTGDPAPPGATFPLESEPPDAWLRWDPEIPLPALSTPDTPAP